MIQQGNKTFHQSNGCPRKLFKVDLLNDFTVYINLQCQTGGEIDLLPDQHQLELLIQHKQTHLTIEKQQALVKYVLNHIANDTSVDTDQVLDCKKETNKRKDTS